MRFLFIGFSLLVLCGCCRNSLDETLQVADVLEQKFDFEFPESSKIDNAELFFSRRSAFSSIYMKLRMSQEDFSFFRENLGRRIKHLGAADWGDRKVKSDLSWWDAHLLEHDQEFALSDLEDPEMRKARVFFSTRVGDSGLIEIYLSSEWNVE